MSRKVKDLMAGELITARPFHSVDQIRDLMESHRIHAVPIVDDSGEPSGIITATDLLADVVGATPASYLMSEEIQTVDAGEEVHVAAGIMRKHGIHHVLVTEDGKVTGIISTFDLLKLIEEGAP